MTGEDRPAMPPVRLPAQAELARAALGAPLFARAVELAKWAGTASSSGSGGAGARERSAGLPVGAGGELLGEQLKQATEHLGLTDDEDAPAYVTDAWNLTLDLGLVEFDEVGGQEVGGQDDVGEQGDDGERQYGTEGEGKDEAVGTAWQSAESDLLDVLTGGGSPAEVLEVWREGLESVLADAAQPSLEELLGDLEGYLDGTVSDTDTESGTGTGTDTESGTETESGTDTEADGIDLDALDWDPQEEIDALDSALASLYVLTVTEPAVTTGGMVPLPVLAASLVVPEDMEEPTDDVLEEVSSVMMRLDEQFRILAPSGLVEYRPVDEALTEETDEDGELPEDLDEEDVSRYGMVRLTPLGLHGVQTRLREAGVDAPAVGDLAEADAVRLLAALPGYGEDNAQAEIESWLAARTPLAAARELLAAARGTDEDAPARRLACQQALSLAGAEAEPALREVLEDRQLGGLARVWLAEHGAQDVPQPDEEMIFWLTVDTLAAQLATAGEPAELKELVQGLVDQHAGFFDKAWRVDHPATGEVLEAMGRAHPDKQTAKDARKAAFKARGRTA